MAVVVSTACDYCGQRSRDYTEWPQCRTCMREVCPDDMAPGTHVQDSERNVCECRPCAAMFSTAAPGDFR